MNRQDAKNAKAPYAQNICSVGTMKKEWHAEAQSHRGFFTAKAQRHRTQFSKLHRLKKDESRANARNHAADHRA